MTEPFKNPQPGQWRAEDHCRGKIADYKPFSMVDGEGVRHAIYVSGCLFACRHCFNKAIQNFNAGIEYTAKLEDRIIADLAPDHVQGLTLLGGEPFLNTPILLPLVKRVRQVYGTNKDIWSWSGYYYEELLQDTLDKLELLSLIDVLVDGRFDFRLKDLKLTFRGSSNQRIIDVPSSLKTGKVVLWRDELYD